MCTIEGSYVDYFGCEGENSEETETHLYSFTQDGYLVMTKHM